MKKEYQVKKHVLELRSEKFNNHNFFELKSLNEFIENKLFELNIIKKDSINKYFLANIFDEGVKVEVNTVEFQGNFHSLSCSHERVLTKWLSCYNQFYENKKYFEFFKLVFYYINNQEPLKEILDNDFNNVFGEDLYLWQASLENMTVRSFEYLDSKRDELKEERKDFFTAVFYALYDYSIENNESFYLNQFNNKHEFLARINDIIEILNEDDFFIYEN